MKKLLALLMAFLPGHMKADAAQLGSDADPVRQMLFASQSLKEQVSRMHLDGSPGPLQMIADASKLVEAGKKDEASLDFAAFWNYQRSRREFSFESGLHFASWGISRARNSRSKC